MISYTSERIPKPVGEVFEQAVLLVQRIPNDKRLVQVLRCHELARAVGAELSLEVQDGRYANSCQHSWLWVQGGLLDVYAVGRLPPVQFISTDWPLAKQEDIYRGGPTRDDINEAAVQVLRLMMNQEPGGTVQTLLLAYGQKVTDA